MKLLGISAFHRDAAAALLVDGRPVASVQEDRFTKRLQDESFPIRAARACLAQGGLTVRDLDGVVFYEKPLRKFERVLASQLAAFPRSSRAFARNMFTWLGDRLWMKNRIANELEIEDASKIYFTEHQQAHAAAAFYSSPFEEAAVLTIDDVGEWATTTLSRGAGVRLELLGEVRFPHSLGLFVSAVAQYLGLEPGAQDHLLEALAPYGEPRYREVFEQLARPLAGGSFEIEPSAFRYAFDHETLFSAELVKLLGPARIGTSPLRFEGDDQRDADVAASLQAVIEERSLELCRELHRRVPLADLCFAGRLAENRSLNARLLADGPFERIYVPPCPDDAGAALGAALYVHHALSGGGERHVLGDAYLGMGIERRPEDGAQDLADPLAALLERLLRGERLAWVRGALELGSHSLGHRSLLADPRPADARTRLLECVQHGEPYLPIQVAVTAERAADFFELPSGAELPLRLAQLMLPATAELARAAPSAVRPDGRAWPLVVDAGRDPDFHGLLTSFGAASGAPLLLHGTFGLRGSPIVRIEGDAVDAFRRSSLDGLVVEDRLYERAKG
jgi:carbamoyltransferase